MRYSFHPEAMSEFISAIVYYDNSKPGLGADFAIEIHSAIENVATFPMGWPILADGLRRCLVHRFPYGIIYSRENDSIFILAVMHLHRDPEYWQTRRIQ